MINHSLSLEEKWKADAEAYKNGAVNKTLLPQCNKCRFYLKDNVMNCEKYVEENKPSYILFCEKECNYFENNQDICFNVSSKYKESLYGGILGFCIGDMLGVPVEFSSRIERKKDPVKELRAYGTYHQGFGVWSDDSSLMIALLVNLAEGYSLDKLAQYFVKYYQEGLFTPEGKMFDIGNSTRFAIENIMNGVPPVECGGNTECDNGNGSLMRILPIAYLEIEDYERRKIVEEVSSITHRHKRSILAGIIYINFLANILKGMSKDEAYDKTIDYVMKECKEDYQTEFNHFNRILNKSIIHEKEENIKSSGYVVDTLEAVFWLMFNGNSHAEIVLNAVNLGGDTDTIAAIAGGLAGAYYGYSKLNKRWVQNIARLDDIKCYIDEFSSKCKFK